MSSFTNFEIYPNFAGGFAYRWEMHASFPAKDSTEFVLEQAGNIFGEGSTPIAEPLAWNRRAYLEDCRRLVSKDKGPFYRVRIGGTSDASDWIQPNAHISRRDFLQLREMIRLEYVQLRNKTGVKVLIFEQAKEGPVCKVCRDPVTGDIRNPSCPVCNGSGYDPPYYAPTESWASFSAERVDKKFDSNDRGVSDDRIFQIRVLPQPHLEKNDVLFDMGSGRAYYISKTSNITELRRQPVAVSAVAREIPTNRSAYKLFTNAAANFI